MTAGETRFTDRVSGVSIAYPQAWARVAPAEPTILLAAGERGGVTCLQLAVTPWDVPEAVTLAALDAVMRMADAVVVFEQPAIEPGFPRDVTIDGRPGRRYRYAPDGLSLVHDHYLVVHRRYSLSLVMQASTADYPGLEATFDAIVGSVHVGAPAPVAVRAAGRAGPPQHHRRCRR